MASFRALVINELVKRKHLPPDEAELEIKLGEQRRVPTVPQLRFVYIMAQSEAAQEVESFGVELSQLADPIFGSQRPKATKYAAFRDRVDDLVQRIKDAGEVLKKLTADIDALSQISRENFADSIYMDDLEKLAGYAKEGGNMDLYPVHPYNLSKAFPFSRVAGNLPLDMTLGRR